MKNVDIKSTNMFLEGEEGICADKVKALIELLNKSNEEDINKTFKAILIKRIKEL